MSALVTHVWTMEPALTEWMDSRAAVYRDSVEIDAKQVSLQQQWNSLELWCNEARWNGEEGFVTTGLLEKGLGISLYRGKSCMLDMQLCCRDHIQSTDI